jgi:hypothetical protein
MQAWRERSPRCSGSSAPIGPYRSADVGETVELTASIGLPLLAPRSFTPRAAHA